jgi:hypothetical protein
MRNRYYSSYLGRFLSKDPPRDSHENRYNYALNNPITFIDPLGTETVIIWNDIQTRQHVKDLIEYERKHGTSAAISDFEPTWFGENSYKMKNVHVMTNQGMVDLDWFFCICHKSSGVTAVNTGVVGAWIGSHVLPGWGTAIGGAGGAIVGMLTPQAKLAYYEMKFGWSLADSNNRWAHLKAIGNDEEQIAIKMAQRIMEGASIETVFAEFGIPTGAKDPNQKTGPKGFGNACYIKPDGLFVYRVDFENDKSASAPAQVVTITDQLHTNLDWSTFELTEVGFGDHLIQIPPSTQHFEHKEPMRYNDRDIEVQIDIGIDQNTGIITAWFTTIDPLTGLPPDVSTGFLPPEDGTGRGQGHFSYIVKADENLATGSEIRNIASITFDFGETIATNQVDPHDPDQGTDPGKEVPNTIDSDSPTSSVQPLPASSPLVFDVQWAGADGNGSGPSSYSVYMQDNSADFKLWLSDTTQAAAKFRGKSGHTYGFFSIAKDNVGNYEAIKNEPEAETTVLLVEGDVNGDGKADLTDVILILKIISGIELTDPVYTDYDINSDGRIGIEEAINALHEISGIR